MLTTRQKQFQRRLARRWINAEQQEAANGGVADASAAGGPETSGRARAQPISDENAGAGGRSRTGLSEIQRARNPNRPGRRVAPSGLGLAPPPAGGGVQGDGDGGA